MIPDNVEKIIMIKEDYDRNVEQMLLEKIKLEQELQRKDNNWNELKEELKKARKELQPGELIIGQGLIDNILDKIKELENDN